MTNSSEQNTYSITLDNTDNMNTSSGVFTISEPYNYMVSGDTITLDLDAIGAAQTVTLTSSGLDSISITDNYFTWKTPIPFEDGFPEWDDFQKMCKEYPGLEQTYEKLKTFYVLCKDEWETTKREKK